MWSRQRRAVQEPAASRHHRRRPSPSAPSRGTRSARRHVPARRMAQRVAWPPRRPAPSQDGRF
eukprot:6288882-Prymnesium_polylepis.1